MGTGGRLTQERTPVPAHQTHKHLPDAWAALSTGTGTSQVLSKRGGSRLPLPGVRAWLPALLRKIVMWVWSGSQLLWTLVFFPEDRADGTKPSKRL